ncbi:MAG: hypothetical protein PHU70_02070 [Dehalococcoidia bacterium]|nr:hypothetical protein [Dehalococcoidia bacterium]
MRYGVSGVPYGVLGNASSGGDAASTGALFLCHGTVGLTTGRVFWLRSLWACSAASAVAIALQDASYGATSKPASQVFRMPVASAYPGSANGTVLVPTMAKVDFPAPGLKFSTQCTVIPVDGTTLPQGAVGGCGYEE